MKGVDLFRHRLARQPVRAASALALEYGGFVAACAFSLTLVATRVPLRAIDEATGSRFRERFIDLIARVSPG